MTTSAPATADLAAEIVIVGAGPAGSATALMLAPFHHTLLVDETEPGQSAHRIPLAESLPGAAARLLRDMGIWQDFQRQDNLPCLGRRSLWGGTSPDYADSVRDPDGPGWHLDRAAFDLWLRNWASRRGAALVVPAKAKVVERMGEAWRLTLVRNGRPLSVTARYVVDAGGRAAPIARKLGLTRRRDDRLVCRWLGGASAGPDGTIFVAAERDGWWHTTALFGGRRILAFYTDGDLSSAKETAAAGALLARARTQPGLGALLAAIEFRATGPAGYCAAHGASIEQAAGAGWIAVGDAALACDPLSAQGLMNALYSAFLAAGAIRKSLAGEIEFLSEYQHAIDQMRNVHRAHLAAWYGLERRWPHEPFWARRTMR